VFSQDIKRAMAVARKIEKGICHIDGPTVADEAQPSVAPRRAATDVSAARR